MLLYSVLNNKDTIYDDYLEDRIYNLLDKTFILPTSFEFSAYIVPQEYTARPDLLSKKAYGDSMYADAICKINGISNPFELNEGMVIALPAPEYILDFAVKPKDNESEKDDVQLPIQKNTVERRSPNESILGDHRFKIDRSSGIIIY